MIPESAHSRNESGHTSYENLKMEVKFDHNPRRGHTQSNQNDREQEGNVLGGHKRDSFQPKTTHKPPYNSTQPHPSEKVLPKNTCTFLHIIIVAFQFAIKNIYNKFNNQIYKIIKK